MARAGGGRVQLVGAERAHRSGPRLGRRPPPPRSRPSRRWSRARRTPTTRRAAACPRPAPGRRDATRPSEWSGGGQPRASGAMRPLSTRSRHRPVRSHPGRSLAHGARPTTDPRPSKVSAFTSCPLAFRFSQIERRPEPPSAPAVKGTLVHAALERLFWHHPAGERTPDAAALELERAWDALQDDKEVVEARPRRGGGHGVSRRRPPPGRELLPPRGPERGPRRGHRAGRRNQARRLAPARHH